MTSSFPSAFLSCFLWKEKETRMFFCTCFWLPAIGMHFFQTLHTNRGGSTVSPSSLFSFTLSLFFFLVYPDQKKVRGSHAVLQSSIWRTWSTTYLAQKYLSFRQRSTSHEAGQKKSSIHPRWWKWFPEDHVLGNLRTQLLCLHKKLRTGAK